MSKVQQLREMLKQHLSAADEESFERMIMVYEEEISHLIEENKRVKVLEAVFNPQVHLYRADMQQLSVMKEENFPKQQEWNLCLDQEDSKEEQEKICTSQEGRQLHGLEEAGVTKFPFTTVSVKSANNGEKPQTSQVYNSQSDKSREAEPLGSSASHRMLTAVGDRENYGGPQPGSSSGPYNNLQPNTAGGSSDSCETETGHSYGQKQIWEICSGLNCLKNSDISVNKSSCDIASKQFVLSEYGKALCHTNYFKQLQRILANEKPCSLTKHYRLRKQKGNLNRHTRRLTGEKPFDCSECGKLFRLTNDLKKHMRMHTGEKPGEKEKGNLNRHTRQLTGEKPFDCPECGKLFRLTNSLKAHMRMHSGEKPFGCSECGKRLALKSTLKAHMTIHTGEKPFSCNECGKRFRQRDNLRSHMLIHAEKKRFGCSECGKRFAQKGYLTMHMRSHTGQKPFGCCECGKRFASLSSLARHLRSHTGDKPFCCSECGKRFGQKSHLDKHMRIHTREKPFDS